MSDDNTPRLGLPYLAAGQAQKHVTVNQALAVLDGQVQTTVESRMLVAQPASPPDGALYILPFGATGAAWAGKPAGALMRFEAGGWTRLAVGEGHLAWIVDEGVFAVFDGAGWGGGGFQQTTAATSPGGAAIGFEIVEEDVTLVGASATTAIAIPARALVLAVSTRTIAAVTGAASYDCGTAADATAFGSTLGAALNSRNVGVVGPFPVYADTPVVLTAVGGAFTGGQVRVAIQFARFAAPAEV